MECEKARMEAWCIGRPCARSQNEGIADAQEAGITWIPNAVAAGEARGDAAAVAANTESPDEAGTFADWRDDDGQDPDDADAFGLAEATREGDAARAEIAETTWDAEARHEADDDGLTTEESRDAAESVSSLDDSWERDPVSTVAGRRAQTHNVCSNRTESCSGG